MRKSGIADKRTRLRIEHSESRAKRGQGLVEFAFCLPLMLLLMLGTLDFGQIFFEYIEMRGAVREGAVFAARYSSESGREGLKGVDAAKNMVLTGGGDESEGGLLADGNTDVTVTYTGSDGNEVNLSTAKAGDSITVTVWAERTFHPTILSYFSRIGLDTVTLSASSDAKVWT